jgi:DNA modification methylase
VALILADACAIPLRNEVVQCVVTSPPYWRLRDYGVRPHVWDGTPSCRHQWGQGHPSGDGAVIEGEDPFVLEREDETQAAATARYCRSCGAWWGALGLEPTLDAYVRHLVTVFREVWRVLREDGVCWLNLGDSYAGSWGAQSRSPAATIADSAQPMSARQIRSHPRGTHTGSLRRTPGLKAKDLCLIPARVALKLQSAGWYVRADVIWSKPNSLPESVRDRPTRSHEYLFLLAKNASYFWDADAVREPHSPESLARITRGRSDSHKWSDGGPGRQTIAVDLTRACHPSGRNLRSVWTIAPEAYSGEHFAVMPESLAERCILAGSRVGDLVLDPFVGTGTVTRTAISLGRRAAGCDLQWLYLHQLARERCRVTRGLPLEFADVTP